MDLKDDLVEFLTKGREILHIHFEAFGYAFSPGEYSIIGEMIEKGRITVSNSSLLAVAWSGGAEASWKYEIDAFWFKPDADLGKDKVRAVVAHEAAHAIHDVLRPGTIDRPIAEAIGYLAESLARIVQGRGPLTDKKGSVDPIRAEAMRVAEAIWDKTGTRVMKVSKSDADALQAVVASHQHYIDQGPTVNFSGIDR